MDIRYIAGNFDADGSISLRHGKNRKTGWITSAVIVQNASTYLPLLQEFQKRFGGPIGVLKRQKSSHSPAWVWRLSSHQACKFLREIYPYLMLKKERADLAFDFQSSMGSSGQKITKEKWDYRMELRDKIMKLNKRKGGRRGTPDKF